MELTRAELLRTEEAARLVGVTPRAFNTWAARRGIRAYRTVRLGRTTYALWSADEVLAGRPTRPE